MKKNMGNIDKALRALFALVIAALYFTDKISGTTAIIALILSGVFILTSLIGFCPLYLPLRVSTIKKDKKP